MDPPIPADGVDAICGRMDNTNVRRKSREFRDLTLELVRQVVVVGVKNRHVLPRRKRDGFVEPPGYGRIEVERDFVMSLDGANWTSKEPPGGHTVEHSDQFQPELRDRQVGQLGSFAGAIYRNARPFTGGVRLQDDVQTLTDVAVKEKRVVH